MQNNGDEWNKKYDSLIQAKIERLRAISPSEMTELRQQWTVLVGDIQQSLGEDPGSAKAQELAARWVNLLEHLMGGPVDPSMIGSAAAYQTTGSWSPSGTAFADKRVWDFVSNALASGH